MKRYTLEECHEYLMQELNVYEVPEDIQSAVRMAFNEALAGGPNMNGDSGPTLNRNHALDCVWAIQKIYDLEERLAGARSLLGVYQ